MNSNVHIYCLSKTSYVLNPREDLKNKVFYLLLLFARLTHILAKSIQIITRLSIKNKGSDSVITEIDTIK